MASLKISPKRKWAASERIAFKFLEDNGYHIIEEHKKIVIDGVEISDVDAIALGPDGEKYAIEVKAGKLDVIGVRQAYTNALLTGAKPLVVCRGFADDAAEKLAEKLGVKVIVLPDWIVLDPDELLAILEDVILETLLRILEPLLAPSCEVKAEDMDIVLKLAKSSSLADFANKLGVSLHEAAKILAKLKREYKVFNRCRRYSDYNIIARLLLYRMRLEAVLDEIKRIENILNRVL